MECVAGLAELVRDVLDTDRDVAGRHAGPPPAAAVRAPPPAKRQGGETRCTGPGKIVMAELTVISAGTIR
jgi:hypothetical protein